MIGSRRTWQRAFFLLFILAPVLDLFRYDLYRHHFILFGHALQLGIQPDQTTLQISLQLFLRGVLPVLSIVLIGGYVAWRWGRLYCGWLCPHFLAIETINQRLRRTIGKPSLWDKARLPMKQQDGTVIRVDGRWWPTAVLILAFSFLWALTALTYLVPPAEVYAHLIQGELSRNQWLFLMALILLFGIEFTFARHLFCRYACAVGVMQSLLWMANLQALVVGYDRTRAAACRDCDASCEHACPMRLKPRAVKRKKYTCTQCMACVLACTRVQEKHASRPVLKMIDKVCALDMSARGFGRKPHVPADCYKN